MKKLIEKIKLNRILNGLDIRCDDIHYGDNFILCERFGDQFVIYNEEIEDYFKIDYNEIHYILLDYIHKKFGLCVRDYPTTLVNDNYEISLEDYERNY